MAFDAFVASLLVASLGNVLDLFLQLNLDFRETKKIEKDTTTFSTSRSMISELWKARMDLPEEKDVLR